MSTNSHILVGIDYSKNSANALREAARIASWNDGELHCVHIIEHDVISTFRKQKDFDEDHVMKATLKHLENYVEKILGTGHRCQCHLRSGHPFKELIDEIKCRQATLLVLGSRGLTKKGTHSVGSLAQRCVRMAPVEVLLIRQQQETPYQKIIACVDFSETAKLAAYIAADIAIQDNAYLELLHIHTLPAYPNGDGIGVPSITAEYAKSYLDQQTQKLELMAEKLRASCDNVPVEATVLQDSVGHGIRTYIDKVGADLVVLGTRGRTKLSSLFLGTKAEYIIHSSPCSVLAVKPENFRHEIS